MSTETTKELRVASFDSLKKVIFLAKQLLVPSETLNIISGTNSAGTACGAAETLKRLGYIVYKKYQTTSLIYPTLNRTKSCMNLNKNTIEYEFPFYFFPAGS